MSITPVFALQGSGIYFREGVAVTCACIIGLMWGRLRDRSLWFLVVALLLSVGGDWFLSHRQGITMRFVYGIALFFAAHAGFLLFALKNGKCAMRGLPYIMVSCLVFFALALYPAIDSTVLLIAVFLYLLISCCSLAAAINMKSDRFVRGFFIAGISCIVFSDTLIALAEFLNSNALSFLIMPTYYLSHILITLSALHMKTNRQPSTGF